MGDGRDIIVVAEMMVVFCFLMLFAPFFWTSPWKLRTKNPRKIKSSKMTHFVQFSWTRNHFWQLSFALCHMIIMYTSSSDDVCSHNTVCQ
jgi:hypothetical protein